MLNIKKSGEQLVRALSVALLTAGAIGSAQADGFVTTNEAGVDAIYAQSTFGATPIDIRFLSSLNIFNSSLLVIDSNADFNLLATYQTGSPVVSMFFTDQITFCGSPDPSIVGCGSTPGSVIAIDSKAAATSIGAVVLAHELGHNLGLVHVAGDDTNLMNPIAYEGPAPAPLLASQVARIFTSPLIRQDSSGYYIQVQPYAILASIPEPSTYLLMGAGLGLIAFMRPRKHANG